MIKTAFIVNPIAGGKSSKAKLKLVKDYAIEHNIDLYLSEYPGHVREIASSIKSEVNRIVVLGGDGTINEVAGEIINTKIELGIIPAGSGNGLSYHLKIPMDPGKALQNLDKPGRLIDTIQINGQVIVNVGGLGFDGHVAKLFNESKARGNLAYIRLILSQLIQFKEQHYTIRLDGKTIEGLAFMIAFANGSEFGNRFIIDPIAQTTDGECSIIIVRKPPYSKLIPLLIDGFKGRLKESKYYKRYAVKEFSISSPGSTLHRDGEVSSDNFSGELKLKINPNSLKVIY